VDILLDLNVVFDLLLQREFYDVAEKVYKLSRNNNFKLWMCASSVDNLYYSIHKEAKRLALEKERKYSKEKVDMSCLRRNWNFPQSMLAKIKL